MDFLRHSVCLPVLVLCLHTPLHRISKGCQTLLPQLQPILGKIQRRGLLMLKLNSSIKTSSEEKLKTHSNWHKITSIVNTDALLIYIIKNLRFKINTDMARKFYDLQAAQRTSAKAILQAFFGHWKKNSKRKNPQNSRKKLKLKKRMLCPGLLSLSNFPT